MTLGSYLRTGKNAGITRFYVETIEISDGETSFYIHPVDDTVRIGGEPIHYAVLGNLLEPIEVDTIRDGKQQIDALHFELDKYISSLNLKFHPAEESSNNIPALLQKARQVLAAFDLNRNTENRQTRQIEEELKHLRTELLRHEAMIGVESAESDDFSAFSKRVQYVFSAYRKDIRSLEKATKEVIEDLSLVTQCKSKLMSGDWASSTYGCIQILIVKICGLAADRLRRSLKYSHLESYNSDEF